MKVRTERPEMTAGRAALLVTIARYSKLSQFEQVTGPEGPSLLEIQKLMYFLQQAGQPLRLNYVKARYGPYADNLNHVLQTLEGHYVRGYGDRTQQVLKLSPITLLPGAEDEGKQWLDNHPDETAGRIETVIELATGFASAYGLELLATVHWVAVQEGADQVIDASGLTQHIASWNDRKGRLFTETHVHRATDHLRSLGWLAVA